MTSTVAIIPVRAHSKRLPSKNKLLLGGIPLFMHSVHYALQQPEISKVVISTDDLTIKEIAEKEGIEVLLRPSHLAADDTPTIAVLQHVVTEFYPTMDHVVLLQATNPLRPSELFSEAWNTYSVGNFDSLFTVSPVTKKLGTLHANKFVPFNYQIGQRSQDIQPYYEENGLLYIAKASLIKEGILVGPTHLPWVVDHPYSGVDIDTADNFSYASFMLETHSKK